VLVGRLHDLSGNYVSGFSLLIGFAVAGAIAVALLPNTGARNAPDPSMVPERA
jgi:hypothetical protein